MIRPGKVQPNNPWRRTPSVVAVDVPARGLHASELIHRVERGAGILVTEPSRPVAKLVPFASRAWRGWADIDDLFAGSPDPDWDSDRDQADDIERG